MLLVTFHVPPNLGAGGVDDAKAGVALRPSATRTPDIASVSRRMCMDTSRGWRLASHTRRDGRRSLDAAPITAASQAHRRNTPRPEGDTTSQIVMWPQVGYGIRATAP